MARTFLVRPPNDGSSHGKGVCEVVAALVPARRTEQASTRIRPVQGGLAELERFRVDEPLCEVLDELRDDR